MKKFTVSLRANDGSLFATDIVAENEAEAIEKVNEADDFLDFVKKGIKYAEKHKTGEEFAIIPGTVKAVPTV